MADVTLAAEIGRPLGSRATRRLRREGKIPGVIYGHGTEPVAVAVPARELRIALNGEAGANQLLSLQTGSTTYLTLAREMQRHPIAQTVTHVDFQIVRRDEVISADVSIVLIGEALEVHHGDGLVDQQMFTLAINARPADIPTSVELDISGLAIGDQLRVSDLSLPAGVTTDVDSDTAVAIGQPPRVVTLEAEGEGEAAEEGAVPSEPTTEAGDTSGAEG
jgi:large subunit ribosomal protein L25